MKRITIPLALSLLMAATPVLASTFYRWVDDNGVTHYSATPPEGRASESVRTWGQPSSDQSQALEALEQHREARDAARQEDATANTPATPKPPEEYCAQHRENLKVLTDRPVVRRTDPDTGEVTTLDAEQREAMMQQTRDALKACS